MTWNKKGFGHLSLAGGTFYIILQLVLKGSNFNLRFISLYR